MIFSIKSNTSEANANLFISPPDIPFTAPGHPITVLAHLDNPNFFMGKDKKVINHSKYEITFYTDFPNNYLNYNLFNSRESDFVCQMLIHTNSRLKLTTT